MGVVLWLILQNVKVLREFEVVRKGEEDEQRRAAEKKQSQKRICSFGAKITFVIPYINE